MTHKNNQAEVEEPVRQNNADIQSILQLLGTNGVSSIIDALKSDGSGASAIQAIVGNLQLSPEQQPLVDLLMSMTTADENGELIEGEMQESDYMDEEEGDDYEMYENQLNNRENVYDIRRFRRELRDLRNVNDTLATALGACPYCWGGDSQCQECDGEGTSGAYEPDFRLFNELVMPAVRRIRSSKRTRQKRSVREQR